MARYDQCKALDPEQSIDNLTKVGFATWNICKAYLSMPDEGTNEKALEYAEELLRISKLPLTLSAFSNPMKSSIYCLVGEVFAGLGKSDEALTHYQDGLTCLGIDASTETIPKDTSKDYCIMASEIMSRIGCIHSDSGEHEKAVKICSQYVAISRDIGGHGSTSYMVARYQLARSLFMAGNVSDAIETMEKTVEDARRVLGLQQPIAITCLKSLEQMKRSKSKKCTKKQEYILSIDGNK